QSRASEHKPHARRERERGPARRLRKGASDMAPRSRLYLHQVISLVTFAIGVNICLGFTVNRYKRSEDWDEGIPS
ncbi:hypothetical protein NDU88_003165, partial [Pleurodeles waltl]